MNLAQVFQAMIDSMDKHCIPQQVFQSTHDGAKITVTSDLIDTCIIFDARPNEEGKTFKMNTNSREPIALPCGWLLDDTFERIILKGKKVK